MFGFHNKVAWVELGTGTCEIKKLPEGYVERFIGGSILGAALLKDLIHPDTKPLSPQNPIILMTGPFTASPVPSTSRHSYVTLSPLTGIFAESSCGGSLAYHLKRGGLDGLVITGASSEPVAIVVEDGGICLRPSADLWGLDTFACQKRLRADLDPKGVSASIGPAGENLVRFASVCQDGRKTRVAGRCGVGAVFGSKKLKAIFVSSQGASPPAIADPKGLKATLPHALSRMTEKLRDFGRIGTPGGIEPYEMLGNLPLRNWKNATGQELAKSITGSVLLENYATRRSGCKRCPVRCARLITQGEGPFRLDEEQEGPEYETVAGFGALCLIDDLKVIAKANEVCNKLGLDTISSAAVCAFAMEAVERGIIDHDLLQGLDLEFGNGAALIRLLERMAAQDDELAEILGHGTHRAAMQLGQNAIEFAIEVKGLEFPLHDPRFSWGQALSYATSNRGACHLAAFCHPWELGTSLPELGYETSEPGREREKKALFVATLQDLMTLADSLCLCKFAFLFNAVYVEQVCIWYNLVAGSDLDVEEFMALGERGFNLKRLINNSRGISRKDDRLPQRMRTYKRVGRDYVHDVPPLGQLLSDYYEVRGWSEEGIPLPETVHRLGLAAS